jgi:hypothetical protein
MTPLNAAGRLAALVTLALAPTMAMAMAGDVTLGSLVIHQPWARATPGGAQVGGGYLTIENKGTTPDRLTGGSFAASGGFELHSMTMNGGIMEMRPTGPLEIPPGKSVTLDPSGLHIMFTGLKRGLKKGETVPGTLTFEHAGTAKVDFAVGGIADKGPSGAAAAHAGQSMPGMKMD